MSPSSAYFLLNIDWSILVLHCFPICKTATRCSIYPRLTKVVKHTFQAMITEDVIIAVQRTVLRHSSLKLGPRKTKLVYFCWFCRPPTHNRDSSFSNKRLSISYVVTNRIGELRISTDITTDGLNFQRS